MITISDTIEMERNPQYKYFYHKGKSDQKIEDEKLEIESITKLYNFLTTLNNSPDDKIMKEINIYKENLCKK